MIEYQIDDSEFLLHIHNLNIKESVKITKKCLSKFCGKRY